MACLSLLIRALNVVKNRRNQCATHAAVISLSDPASYIPGRERFSRPPSNGAHLSQKSILEPQQKSSDRVTTAKPWIILYHVLKM